MDNITEIIGISAGSAGIVGSILGFFMRRLIGDIDDIKATLNGDPRDAEKRGLVSIVHANTVNDENRENAFKELKVKFEKYINGNPQKEIDKAINEFRKEIESNYKKK